MRRRLPQFLALVALFGAAGLSTPASAGPSVPERFASPDGGGTDCTTADPCDIVTAINDAPAQSVVVIEPGNYGSPANPIIDELVDNNGPLDIFGLTGSPTPVIYSSATDGMELNNASTLSHIEMFSSGTGLGVFLASGNVDHVIVHSTHGFFGACNVYAELTDSVCTNSGAGDPAVEADGPANYTLTLRGVTAESTGAGGVGLLAQASGSGTMSMSVSNSIIHGATTDISTQSTSSGTAAVTLSHSDYRTTSSTGPGTSTVTGNGSDIKTQPKFLNAATLNFNENTGSATINKGASEPANNTDVLDNPRTLGPAPDMGAYEFLQRPAVAKFKISAVSKHSVSVAVKVNPEGLPTTVQLVARLAGLSGASHPVSAHSGRKGKTIHLVLHGLSPGISYQLHAVATNHAGPTNSTKKKVRTRS